MTRQSSPSRLASELAPNGEVPPGGEQLKEDPPQVFEAEELAGSAGTVIVVHGHFHHPAPISLELLHHLDADDTTVTSELDALEDSSSEKPEITIHIPNIQLEQPSHQTLIQPAENDAMPGIGPADFVAVHDVDLFSHDAQECGQFLHIVLAVPICIENQLLGTIRKSSDQGGAIAPVHAVVDYLQECVLPIEGVQQLQGTVRRPIIHDYNFEVIRELGKEPGHCVYDLAYGANVVVGREKCGYRITL